MKAEALKELLIAYAEGTLPSEHKQEVEGLLESSIELRQEVELLQSAFRELQLESEQHVPAHYFTNVLPNIRAKLDNGIVVTHWSIPGFIQAFLRPVAAVTIVVAMFGMYQSLRPVTDRSAIISVLRDR